MLAALSKVTWPHLLLASSRTHTLPNTIEFLLNKKIQRVLTIMHGVPRCGMFKDTSVRSLFRCLSHTMSEIRSAAASSIHAARRSHSARQRYQTPYRRHGNRPTSANENPSPPISPGNCRSAGAPRTSTPCYFASCNVLSLISPAAHIITWVRKTWFTVFWTDLIHYKVLLK